MEEPPYTFAPDLDYPVALAEWHALNGSPTPISGDLKNMTHQDRKAHRDLEIEQFYQN
jgi:hypothetical protein